MYERATKRVVVDAGHGGNDPGAIGNGMQEKDLTLQAAQYMYKRLQELGIPASITRDSDESLSRQERIDSAFTFGKDPDVILVSNHINAGGGEGAEIVYALRNDSTLADMALNNIGEAGQIKRKVYQRRLPENPNQDYYYIIRETKPTEAILVEYGFIDNAKDAAKLKNNLDSYVEGVVKAIAEYSNVAYTPPGVTGETYTVQRGDTLYKIANMFNTTVAELQRLNNLTSDTLTIGQVLQIRQQAEIPSDTMTYTVQKGDTLYKIADMFNTTVAEIKRLNNLTSDIISVGQVLRVKEQESLPELPNDITIYTVQRGDTLYDIANKFNTSVDTIKQLNNLTSNNIYIGQELRVPANEIEDEEEYIIYEVVKGDSLWSIAQRFGITVDELINLNNLTSINLQIGDQLKVPGSNNSKTYTVKNGDTLWSIAKSNNITVDELKSANNLTSNLLSIGQVLIIPR